MVFMAIPKEIREVERPKNTIVVRRGNGPLMYPGFSDLLYATFFSYFFIQKFIICLHSSLYLQAN